MSRYTTWARCTGSDPALRLGAAQRQVLMYLASHANATGAAWPSSRILAGETGLHEVTVRKALDLLGDLRHPQTGRKVFADVVRRDGRATLFQLPQPVAQPVAQDYSFGEDSDGGVAGPVAQDSKAVALGYTEGFRSKERITRARGEPERKTAARGVAGDENRAWGVDVDPGRERGYCPQCGHAWAGHLTEDGCCYRCGCEARP